MQHRSRAFGRTEDYLPLHRCPFMLLLMLHAAALLQVEVEGQALEVELADVPEEEEQQSGEQQDAEQAPAAQQAAPAGAQQQQQPAAAVAGSPRGQPGKAGAPATRAPLVSAELCCTVLC